TRPAEFVAHDQVTPSSVPVWVGGRLEPRSLVLRAYVGASGDSYAAMPGGLTRVSSARDVSVVSIRRGGGSKDTWVLAEGAAVRDRLSEDTWRVLNQLHHDFRLRHGRIQLDDVLVHLNRMMTDLAAFGGMMENTMRGHGWRFLDIGRRLERSINLTTLLRTT